MKQTSIKAYESIKKEGLLNNMQGIVFNGILKFGPITNQSLAVRLSLPINCVTGRTNELVKRELVQEIDKVTQPNGKSAIRWGII